MVDRQITKWALENRLRHGYSGSGGPDVEQVPALKPGQVLTESHWPFIESWIAWCRFTARELNRRTGTSRWRSTAQKANLRLTPLT